MERLISGCYIEPLEGNAGSAPLLSAKGIKFLGERGAGLNKTYTSKRSAICVSSSLYALRAVALERHGLELAMAEVTTLNDPQHEKDFRRGYARGAQSIVKAICHKLSVGDREKLETWAANELTLWASALDRTDFLPPDIPNF